jgi:hypothetical protein
MALTEREYALQVAAVRAQPGWRPYGNPRCSDCATMTHCETHHKSEGVYPEDEPRGPCAEGCARCYNPEHAS